MFKKLVTSVCLIFTLLVSMARAQDCNEYEESLLWTATVELPGSAKGITLGAGYAFIAGRWGGGLQVVDVSTPENPAIVGSIHVGLPCPNDVAVAGNYAYLADESSGLSIVCVETPSEPYISGSISTPGVAHGVAIHENYAFVADYEHGLQVVDISDPGNPVIVGNADTPVTAFDVAILGSYAYIADGFGGLAVVDINDPQAPAYLSNLDTPHQSRAISIDGVHAYIADGSSGLQVVNITNPESPFIVGSNGEIGPSYGVVVSGGIALVATGYNGLETVSIADPSTPIRLGGIDTPGVSVDVAVLGDYAYVADSSTGGLQVINIEDKGSHELHSGVDTSGKAIDVDIVGSFVYVADYNAGLKIIDIADSVNPIQVGSEDTPGYAVDIEVSQGHAFIADWTSGLQVVDISQPSNPVLVGDLGTPMANGIAVSGDFAYVADYFSGLIVVDVSTPTDPIALGSIETPGASNGVVVSGDLLFVSNGYVGHLLIFDISTPDGPILVGSQGLSGEPNAVSVSGEYAYIANRTIGVQVVNVSEPSNPILVASVETPDASGIDVFGDYAYLADGYIGLHVIDITNPESPTLVGAVDTPEDAIGVAAKGNYAYVADGSSGLQIAPLQCGSLDNWPDCGPECLVLRIEEDGRQNRVCYARLRWIDPFGEERYWREDSSWHETVEVVDGFAIFSSGLDSWTESIELLDVNGQRIGHIGYEWEGGYSDDTKHAFLFLHDELGDGWPWDEENPPPEWYPIEDGWNYYEDGDYPVSMLIPPESNMFHVGNPDDKPVLFIHGFAGYFNYWEDTPEVVGSIVDMPCDAWRFCYPYDQPIQASAKLLGRAIQKLISAELVGVPDYSASRVDLVAHSMGGLVSRSWIQSEEYEQTGLPDDVGNVNSLIMFATPNHGSHISYRMYEEDFFIAEFGEWFLAQDPEAPALRQMIPASDWLFDLVEHPPKPLGHGTPSFDYLVVAGTKDIVLLPHAEIGSQDDGCVSVSSANMLRYGIPLALVDEEHRDIHIAAGAGPLIGEYLSDDFDPNNPVFSQGSNPWVYEYVFDWRSCGGKRTGSAGILEFRVPWAELSTDHYNVRYNEESILLESDKSRLEPVIFPRLERCWDGSLGFFSRRRSIFDLDLLTIGLELPASEYNVQFGRRRLTWLGWGWVLDAICQEPVRFDPLFTTVAELTADDTAILALGASNSTPIWPVDGRSDVYRFYADATFDTLVVSLSSFEDDPDFSLHNMTLEDPTGREIDPSVALNDPYLDFSENLIVGLVQYSIMNPNAGYWLVRHDSSVPSPIMVTHTNGQAYANLTLSPSTCGVGETIACDVLASGIELFIEYELSLTGYYQEPDSTFPAPIGDILLTDLGNGAYRGEVPEVVAGEYYFVLNATYVTGSGDSLHLCDYGTAIVTTDQTPVEPTDPEEESGQNPGNWATQLLGVWPNPFNPSINIDLYSRETQHVQVCIYDIAGRRVSMLLDEEVLPGRQSVAWSGLGENGVPVSSGIYLVHFQAKGISESRKVILLK